MTATVSIIVPYLDAKRFLTEAITSVEQQTFPNWELLLIDDGSTDGGREIADAAAARDNRIQSLVRPPDRTRGAASARNWGIGRSKGEFLAFLDGDDRFLPTKLAAELELMNDHPSIGMTCGGAMWWYPEHQSRNWSDEIRSLRAGVYPGSLLLSRALLLQRMHVPCLCAVMVRRSDLPEGLPFEEKFLLYEDQTLLAKVMLRAPVYVGRHLTSLYRQHPGSTSARAEQAGEYRRTGAHAARADFLDWVRDYIDRQSCTDPCIRDALQIARAVQSNKLASLTLAQRSTLLGWKLQDAGLRIGRKARRIVKAARQP